MYNRGTINTNKAIIYIPMWYSNIMFYEPTLHRNACVYRQILPLDSALPNGRLYVPVFKSEITLAAIQKIMKLLATNLK